MSRANVEIAKRFVDAGNRGDVEAALEFLAEDFVLTWTEPPPGQPPVIHGRDEFAGFWAEWAQFFEGFTRQIEEWIDAPGPGSAPGRKAAPESRGTVPARRGSTRESWSNGSSAFRTRTRPSEPPG